MRLALKLALESEQARAQELVLQERALLQARLEPQVQALVQVRAQAQQEPQVRTQLEPQVQV